MSAPEIGPKMLNDLGPEGAEEMAALVDRAAMIDFLWIDGKMRANTTLTEHNGFKLKAVNILVKLERDGRTYTCETTREFA